jgi:hypothetical protein
MCHSILGITALLALGTRQVVAQTALATECYIKSDSSVHLYTNAVANPCGVVTPDTVCLSQARCQQPLTKEEFHQLLCCRRHLSC